MDLALGTPADKRRLERSPLVNVLWQIKFTTEVGLASGRAAVDFAEALEHPTLFAPAKNDDSAAWRFTSADGTTSVTLTQSKATLETTAYGSWTDHFQPWIDDVTAAVTKVLNPGVITRVGLRYVNALFGETLGQAAFPEPKALVPYIDSSMLGFLSRGDQPAEIEMLQARQVIALHQTKTIVQGALVRSESDDVGYVIDVDCYREVTAAFDSTDLRSCSEILQDLALSVFQASITEEAWLAMNPIEDADS